MDCVTRSVEPSRRLVVLIGKIIDVLMRLVYRPPNWALTKASSVRKPIDDRPSPQFKGIIRKGQRDRTDIGVFGIWSLFAKRDRRVQALYLEPFTQTDATQNEMCRRFIQRIMICLIEFHIHMDKSFRSHTAIGAADRTRTHTPWAL